MRWLLRALLAAEALLLAAVFLGRLAGNAAVLLLVANSVVLIWCAARWRRRPSCCR